MDKISEFAQKNNVTAKALRHYDAMGLLKPERIDEWTGYRLYGETQERYLRWILLLKNVGLSLSEIKALLNGPADSAALLRLLKDKRAGTHLRLNEEITRKLQIDKLITFVEKEGFDMGKPIDLMSAPIADVREIMKNMPNSMALIEQAEELIAANPGRNAVVFRGDMWRLQPINDEYGLEAGDRAITAFYTAITSVLDRLSPKGVIGREHGDEFAGVFFAEKAEAEALIREMIDAYADSEIEGVPKTALGSRFGCVTGQLRKADHAADLREKLYMTVDAVAEARKAGKGAVIIRQF